MFFEIREIENNLLIANLRMYSVEAEFIRFLTCGGRFGYLSVDIFSNSHISITQILNLIDSYAKEKNITQYLLHYQAKFHMKIT